MTAHTGGQRLNCRDFSSRENFLCTHPAQNHFHGDPKRRANNFMGRTPVMIYHQKNLYSLDAQTLRRRLRLEVHLYQLKRQPNSLFALISRLKGGAVNLEGECINGQYWFTYQLPRQVMTCLKHLTSRYNLY